MTYNKELLKQTLQRIKTVPMEYNQGHWVKVEEANVCGTTMCFAGHAAILAGAEVPDPKKHVVADWYVAKDDSNSYLNWRQAEAKDCQEYETVSQFAQRALGLNWDEQDYLFDADRTVEEIEEAVQSVLTYDIMDLPDTDEDY